MLSLLVRSFSASNKCTSARKGDLAGTRAHLEHELLVLVLALLEHPGQRAQLVVLPSHIALELFDLHVSAEDVGCAARGPACP